VLKHSDLGKFCSNPNRSESCEAEYEGSIPFTRSNFSPLKIIEKHRVASALACSQLARDAMWLPFLGAGRAEFREAFYLSLFEA
jgi:hypothetical protein